MEHLSLGSVHCFVPRRDTKPTTAFVVPESSLIRGVDRRKTTGFRRRSVLSKLVGTPFDSQFQVHN